MQAVHSAQTKSGPVTQTGSKQTTLNINNAIGANYDTTGALGVAIKPKDTIVDKLTTVTTDTRARVGKLVPLHTAQSWMGLAQFVQQFVTDGLFYLNSGYLAIKASQYIQTRTPRVSVGEQWATDLEDLRATVVINQGEIIPSIQIVWDKGELGPYVDATAPTLADGRGWGVAMGASFSRGAWDSQITYLCKTGAITINHLELLAVAIAVDIFGREGLLRPDNRRVVIRGDNIAARGIANKWTAEGPAMCAILRILHNTCQRRRVRIWQVHVSTTDNKIADGLSRSPSFHTSSPELKEATK